MDLLTLLRRRLIVPRLSAANKHEAITELVDFLVAEAELPAEGREHVLKAVQRRELERPTGLGNGLAMPHGLVDLLDSEVAALGISQRGLCFGASDGELSQIIILLVTPLSLAYRHSENVRRIAVELCPSDVRATLGACRSRDEVVDLLSGLRR